jgi:hypothetical protein
MSRGLLRPAPASRAGQDAGIQHREIDFRDLADLFPAAVTITRTSDADFKTRQLVVSIDGEHIATLLWGDSITRELQPGSHRMRVHNTLVWQTVEFTLAPREQLYFEVVNRPGPGTLVMTLLFGIGPLYLTVRRM